VCSPETAVTARRGSSPGVWTRSRGAVQHPRSHPQRTSTSAPTHPSPLARPRPGHGPAKACSGLDVRPRGQHCYNSTVSIRGHSAWPCVAARSPELWAMAKLKGCQQTHVFLSDRITSTPGNKSYFFFWPPPRIVSLSFMISSLYERSFFCIISSRTMPKFHFETPDLTPLAPDDSEQHRTTPGDFVLLGKASAMPPWRIQSFPRCL